MYRPANASTPQTITGGQRLTFASGLLADRRSP